MIRWTLAFLVLCAILTPAGAAPSRTKDAAPKQAEKKAPTETAKQSEPVLGDQFNFTAETEVTLDGRPCRYEEVPDNAIITNMQVAPDLKTIVRVSFRKR